MRDADSEIAANVHMLNSLVLKEFYLEPHHMLRPGVKAFHPDMVHMFY
jgi:hypothetical protein